PLAGLDFSDEAIDAARKEAAEWGLQNAQFEVRDVADLPADDRYDVVTAFDCVHDQAKPRRVLAEARRVLNDGGVFLMFEPMASSNVEENIGNPMAIMSYGASL